MGRGRGGNLPLPCGMHLKDLGCTIRLVLVSQEVRQDFQEDAENKAANCYSMSSV